MNSLNISLSRLGRVGHKDGYDLFHGTDVPKVSREFTGIFYQFTSLFGHAESA